MLIECDFCPLYKHADRICYFHTVTESPAGRVWIFASLAAYPASGTCPAGREYFLHTLTASHAGRVQIFAFSASIPPNLDMVNL